MTLVGEKGTELNKSQQAKIGIARYLNIQNIIGD